MCEKQAEQLDAEGRRGEGGEAAYLRRLSLLGAGRALSANSRRTRRIGKLGAVDLSRT